MVKKKVKKESKEVPPDASVPAKVEEVLSSQKKVILPLSVDFPNEGLNNLAKKINEIIESL